MKAIYYSKKREYTEDEFDNIKKELEDQIASMSMFNITKEDVIDNILDTIFTYTIE